MRADKGSQNVSQTFKAERNFSIPALSIRRLRWAWRRTLPNSRCHRAGTHALPPAARTSSSASVLGVASDANTHGRADYQVAVRVTAGRPYCRASQPRRRCGQFPARLQWRRRRCPRLLGRFHRNRGPGTPRVLVETIKGQKAGHFGAVLAVFAARDRLQPCLIASPAP